MSINQLPAPKKHAGFILSIDREYIKSLVDTARRFNVIDFEKITAQQHLVIKQRATLETDPNYLQFLPYINVLREGEDGEIAETLFYRRTKQVGESRLAGNASLGLGGHVEIDDIAWVVAGDDTKYIDLHATFMKNMTQELASEIQGTDEATIKLILETVKFQGIITDFTNDVGNVHLGCLFTVRIPFGTEITVGESELEQIGFIRISDVKTEQHAGVYNTLENWSQIVFSELPALFALNHDEAANSGLAFITAPTSTLHFINNPVGAYKAEVTVRPAGMNYKQAEGVYDIVAGVVDYIGKRLGDPDDEFAGVLNLEERVKKSAAALVNNKTLITTTLEHKVQI